MTLIDYLARYLTGRKFNVPATILLASIYTSAAYGQVESTIVAPAIYENAEAPAGMSTVIAINARTYQAIFHEDQLSDFVNHEIGSMAYRLNGVLTSGFPFAETTWSQYQIEFGESVSPELATNIFDDNFVSDPTLVRSGPLTVNVNAWPADPPGPAPWGMDLQFDQDYFYQGGHLAVLIRHSGSDNQEPGNRLVDSASASSPGTGTDFAGIIASSADATAGNGTAFVPVIRFTGFAVAVPEPSIASPLLCLALAIGTCRRRSSRSSN